MDISYYKENYEPINGKWYIKELLGEGSYGKVFRIEREDISGTYSAALKVITIPASKSEVDAIRSSLGTEKNVSLYYEDMTKKLLNEFQVMEKLKGISNIVSYEDHDIEPHKDGIGYDILIRMELLKPLTKFYEEKSLSEYDIIKLGIDICKALEVCQIHSIIHRDIKPENIFVSPNGLYKLGDFGVAKVMNSQSTQMTKAGTTIYMAPELYKGSVSDASVDLYSLGIVMYRFMNNCREPFLPNPPAMFSYDDKELAFEKRMSGEPLPNPANASEELSKIILKACQYDRLERYASPGDMRRDLEELLKTYNQEKTEEKIIVNTEESSSDKTVSLFDEDSNKTVGLFGEDRNKTVGLFGGDAHNTESIFGDDIKNVDNGEETKQNTGSVSSTEEMIKKFIIDNKIRIFISAAICAVITIFILLVSFNKEIPVESIEGVPEEIFMQQEEVFTLNPQFVPENASVKDVKYLTENEKIAEVSNEGDVKANELGQTIVKIECNGISCETKVFVLEKISANELQQKIDDSRKYLDSVLQSKEISQADVTYETNILKGLLSAQELLNVKNIEDASKLSQINGKYNNEIAPAVEKLKKAYEAAIAMKKEREKTSQQKYYNSKKSNQSTNKKSNSTTTHSKNTQSKNTSPPKNNNSTGGLIIMGE